MLLKRWVIIEFQGSLRVNYSGRTPPPYCSYSGHHIQGGYQHMLAETVSGSSCEIGGTELVSGAGQPQTCCLACRHISVRALFPLALKVAAAALIGELKQVKPLVIHQPADVIMGRHDIRNG